MMQALRWLVPWEPSFAIVVATLLAAMVFIRGCVGCNVASRQKVCFGAGLFCLYAVSHTQIEYYAEHAFFVHQLQSLVLHHLGPFLIVLSAPKELLTAGCPLAAKRWMLRVSAWPPLQYPVNALLNPVTATLVFVGLICFWLLPSVHFIAMLDSRIYALMNASMVLNGLMFWGIVLDMHSRRSAGCRIAMMLAAVPPQILVGALIFFTQHELYPIYTLCGRAFDGMAAITDQQIGGLILWMHAAMMSVIGVLIVIRREFRQAQVSAR